ncbi:hypothetical protein [Catellatospora sichuanensis]
MASCAKSCGPGVSLRRPLCFQPAKSGARPARKRCW